MTLEIEQVDLEFAVILDLPLADLGVLRQSHTFGSAIVHVEKTETWIPRIAGTAYDRKNDGAVVFLDNHIVNWQRPVKQPTGNLQSHR